MYFCNGRGNLCYRDCDCDGCEHWDGSGGVHVKNKWKLFILRIRHWFRKVFTK